MDGGDIEEEVIGGSAGFGEKEGRVGGIRDGSNFEGLEEVGLFVALGIDLFEADVDFEAGRFEFCFGWFGDWPEPFLDLDLGEAFEEFFGFESVEACDDVGGVLGGGPSLGVEVVSEFEWGLIGFFEGEAGDFEAVDVPESGVAPAEGFEGDFIDGGGWEFDDVGGVFAILVEAVGEEASGLDLTEEDGLVVEGGGFGVVESEDFEVIEREGRVVISAEDEGEFGVGFLVEGGEEGFFGDFEGFSMGGFAGEELGLEFFADHEVGGGLVFEEEFEGADGEVEAVVFGVGGGVVGEVSDFVAEEGFEEVVDLEEVGGALEEEVG